MSDLGSSLSRLRTEIEAALAEAAPGLGATLTLGLVENADGTWRLARSAQGELAVHSLTLTLNPGESKGTEPAAASTSAGSAASVTDISEVLTQVLGEPGFDTSARAEVLSEWLQGVDALEAGRVLEWCRSESTSVPEQPLRGAWSRVRRILGFSKLGAPTAADRLLRLLQHHPPEALVRVLNERWKFGTHWNPPGQ
jgi:hypothetical protein